MQNDEFLVFFEGEDHENWMAKSVDPTRGLLVQPRAAVAADPGNNVVAVRAIDQDQATAVSRKLQRDLRTLLNSIATYAPKALKMQHPSNGSPTGWQALVS